MSNTEPTVSRSLLVKQRGGHKAFVTRIIKDAESMINGDSDGLDKIRLSAWVKTLNKRRKIIEGLDNQIWPLLSEDDIEKEILDSENCSLAIEETLLSIADTLDRLKIVNDDDKSMPPLEGDERELDDNVSSFETGSIKASTVVARLPKLTLKTFSGDILKFNEFWESYELSIHYNNTLDAVTKFNKKLSSMKRESEKFKESCQIQTNKIALVKLMTKSKISKNYLSLLSN